MLRGKQGQLLLQLLQLILAHSLKVPWPKARLHAITRLMPSIQEFNMRPAFRGAYVHLAPLGVASGCREAAEGCALLAELDPHQDGLAAQACQASCAWGPFHWYPVCFCLSSKKHALRSQARVVIHLRPCQIANRMTALSW